MTSKPKHQPSTPADRFQPPPRKVLGHPDGKFPVFSSRADMQNPIYLYMPGHLAALARHLGNPATTVDSSERSQSAGTSGVGAVSASRI